MKKENRTISAFRRLLMAALCCVLPAAALAQTGKNKPTPATDNRVYYLPLNIPEKNRTPETKPTDDKSSKKKPVKAPKSQKTRKTEPTPDHNRVYYLPLNTDENATPQKQSSAEEKKPKKKPAKAPKPQKGTETEPTPDHNRVYYLPLNIDENAMPEKAPKDSSTVKRKRRAPKTAPDTTVVSGQANDSVRPTAKRHFMPTRRRIDREVEKNKFVYKGETMMGLTISYGTLNTDNADMFPIFEEINVGGSIVTLNPYIGYFYRDNNCFGVRFGYTHVDGTLDSFGVNLGEQNDIELDIPWIDLSSRRFSASAFHRTYVGLDEKCRFGAFGELELSYTNGDNMFAYKSGDRLKHTRSKSQSVRVLFSPGVAVYALPNVSASVSFGLGGFKYTFTQQYDENGEKTGKRHYSNLNFRLNLLDIRIGLTFHLWNAKKSAKRAFVKQ